MGAAAMAARLIVCVCDIDTPPHVPWWTHLHTAQLLLKRCTASCTAHTSLPARLHALELDQLGRPALLRIHGLCLRPRHKAIPAVVALADDAVEVRRLVDAFAVARPGAPLHVRLARQMEVPHVHRAPRLDLEALERVVHHEPEVLGALRALVDDDDLFCVEEEWGGGMGGKCVLLCVVVCFVVAPQERFQRIDGVRS